MRACGILMPVFSLPGPFGIGTLGKEAFAFVDFLARAKQTYWQILPIGPTGYGDSPYQSFSAFAGNPYFIDFRVLHEQGYLTADEIPAEVPVGPVDYGVLYQQRPVVLQKAADRLLAAASAEYKDFCTAQSFWLDDYALFMAVKAEQGQAGLCDWPDDLRTRQPAAVAAARERLAGQVDYFKAVQFFFYTQWNALKAYANGKGGRYPHLRQPGFQRSVDAAGALPDRRPDPPDAGGRLPPGCLCGRRSALGQSALRLAPPQGRGFCLVEAPDAARYFHL